MSTYFEVNINRTNDLIIVGDFNIKMDLPKNNETILLQDMMESFDLKNNVKFPTHIAGHTVDLVLSENTFVTFRKVTSYQTIVSYILI